ncbi:type II toxin-antitoxin system VapC family toxin [Oryzibacter oryziterrae]|uniref:type II toxin-antitoxin system VapC family toxin n=1 Tax=Oryzibacter oryziterrae TaxID=2766474 RepID=UPI001F3A26EA|nr:type II toxin-antitoxin system VapC family toxin [Oryzibacter oryziterrae]
MTTLLLDTHAWVWTLLDTPALPAGVRRQIEAADRILLSPISFYEIGQKVRLGKWPDMAPHVDGLRAMAEEQGAMSAPLSWDVAMLAARLDWSHRDPFDRVLAATSIAMGVPLVSADAVFDELTGSGRMLPRIWE